ncbi:helix-turn-helix domain-containing protein [Methanoculleus receptaculi]|uniref:helix-turn-helix domain-containing protein n=1 Tax=Methanoculleus receptaculi TaxID=394967 RepID=UPI00384E79D8
MGDECRSPAILLRIGAHKTIIRKAYRYRLSPSTSQVTLLEQTLEICRWVYNDTVAVRKNAWEQEQNSISLRNQQDPAPMEKGTTRSEPGSFSGSSECSDAR